MSTVAVDFDGVIHAYSCGWQGGACYDMPVEGTKAALRALSSRHSVVVFTARTEHEAVWRWLRLHSLDRYVDRVTNVKPQAFAYIDDRAIHFDGDWSAALSAVGARA